MILKALYDYYHRCDDLAPEGLEYKEIAFAIVIDKKGVFQRIDDNRIDKKRTNSYLVVKGIRSGTTPKPYIFWDNVEYLLNYTKAHEDIEREENEPEEAFQKRINERDEIIRKAEKKHKSLINCWKKIAQQHPNNESLQAVCLFYDKNELCQVFKSPLWSEIAKNTAVNLSFKIHGENELIACHNDLYRLVKVDKEASNSQKQSRCLITGKKTIIVESTTPTPIAGAKSTARLISFQINSGYDSYGKSKGHNAPIGIEAEASYTTALKKLLDKDSKNKFSVGNRTFVFWASNNEEASKEIEAAFYMLVGLDNQDDPNLRIGRVQKVFKAIYSGTLRTTLSDKFYILGLSPNAARIAVSYWGESELKEFATNILKHFDDMTIIDGRKEKTPYFGIHSIMSAVTLKGKSSDVQPNLPESVIRSIMEGSPYPYAILVAAIARIRAEQKVNITRAAIIKSYLNRLDNNNKKLTIMVDKENKNQGYLCGRLFATLEYLQERSNKTSTIRSRYMNAASATPSTVFATLLNLSNHHEDKLNKGSQIYFEQMKSEIIDKISTDGFPTHLNLQDQGRFMVGYYHQRQAFYTAAKDETDIILEVEQ